MEKTSSGGLNVIDRDGVYGVLAEDGTFSPVYRVPEEASPPGTPRWTSDLGEHVWDSCVAFVRHAERPAHFLRDSDGIGVTDLTDRGREDARRLGTLLKGYDVSLSSSPVPRCVSTCVSVAEGLGRDLPVERREEVGGYGTALYLDGYAGHVYREPGTTAVLGNLSGRPIEGWHPLEECVRRMMDVILPFLSREGVLTLCVSHDLFVAQLVGGTVGRFPSDRWISYLDGILVCRRGKETYVVWEGEEHPYAGPLPAADISPASPPRRIVLPPSGPLPEVRFSAPGDIVWAGPPSDGKSLLVDSRGYFRHVRADGYPVYGRTYDWAGDFRDGVAPVAVEGVGATFVTDFGDLLHNRWFREVRGYREGVAAVRDGKGWFHIGMDGEPLYPERYDSVTDSEGGRCLCTSGGVAVERILAPISDGPMGP